MQSNVDRTSPLIESLVKAGYWDRLDIQRLLTDLRAQPGCENLKLRTLQNYLSGRTTMSLRVYMGFIRLLKLDAKTLYLSDSGSKGSG